MYLTNHTEVKEFLKENSHLSPTPETGTKDADQSFWGQFTYFFRTTTNHGFGHLIDSNENFSFRIIWAVVIACFGGAVIVLICSSVSNLLNPTLTSEILVNDHPMSKEGLNLPDIHICDTSIFNATRLRDIGFDDQMSTYLALATSEASFQIDFFNNTQNAEIQNFLKQKFDTVLATTNLTVTEIMHYAAIKCEDIVWHCTQLGRWYNKIECCNTFFTSEPHIGIYGSCISTRTKTITQKHETRDAGFVVYLQPNEDVIKFNVTLIKPEHIFHKGLYYTVSSPAIFIHASLNAAGRYAAPNTWISVPITVSQVDNNELKNNMLAPQTCVDVKDVAYMNDRSFLYDYYSRENCILSDRYNSLKEVFNCSAVFMKHNNGSDTVCDPASIINYRLMGSSNASRHVPQICPVECSLETYDISPSYAAFNTESLTAYEYNLTGSEPVALHFFYPTFRYQMRKNYPVTFLKWLGEVGGNLGLFLGASLISLLEILAFFIRYCIKSLMN